MEKGIQGKQTNQQQKSWVALFISDKMDLKANRNVRDKGCTTK